MSKADEMFKELGYEKDENKHYIHYIKNDTFRRICFIKRNQRVETIMPFTVQELKAINEKVRELRLEGVNYE